MCPSCGALRPTRGCLGGGRRGTPTHGCPLSSRFSRLVASVRPTCRGVAACPPTPCDGFVAPPCHAAQCLLLLQPPASGTLFCFVLFCCWFFFMSNTGCSRRAGAFGGGQRVVTGHLPLVPSLRGCQCHPESPHRQPCPPRCCHHPPRRGSLLAGPCLPPVLPN